MTRNLQIPIYTFLSLMLGGTIGYHFLEHWSLLDSLYMTVITLTTVGFGETHPLSPAGKLFTGVLILFGVGTLAFAVTRTAEALIENRVVYWRRMRMEIKRLDGHIVVCGFGRMGRTICDHLVERDTRVVVIEKDPAKNEELDRRGIPHIIGDATEDSVLSAAGIERASALATVLHDDAENLFVTLSSRTLNTGLNIVARSSTEKNERKMIAAGASRVLNPYRNGGRLMVRQLLHPTVTDFIDVINSGKQADLELEEVELHAGSALAGVPLSEAPIRRELDVIVIAIRRADHTLQFNPAHDTRPAAGDVLIVLGSRHNLGRLSRIAASA